jgi:hypothetical protein
MRKAIERCRQKSTQILLQLKARYAKKDGQSMMMRMDLHMFQLPH